MAPIGLIVRTCTSRGPTRLHAIVGKVALSVYKLGPEIGILRTILREMGKAMGCYKEDWARRLSTASKGEGRKDVDEEEEEEEEEGHR